MFTLDLLDSCDYSNSKSLQAAVLFLDYTVFFSSSVSRKPAKLKVHLNQPVGR